ncbi:alcohol dehydrogenase catalytic domain-containing protein [Gordonia sp. X0973]|nr:alcohol dehydrogenase catalytic domain-containing protein [Gordonia sp. X0973]
MTTRATVLDEGVKEFEIVELDFDEPGQNEVHIKYVTSGLCHSDWHLIDGFIIPRFPIIAGHEG